MCTSAPPTTSPGSRIANGPTFGWKGRTFGDVPLNVELKLEVWDSPNSAGVVIDAVRCAKLGLDRKLGGALEAPSSYFMKSPPVQFTDDEAHDLVEAFVRRDEESVSESEAE